MAACGGRECRCSPARMPPSGGGDKRGQGHHMVPLPPLDSPKPPFALTHRRCAAKRGTGLGSVRFPAYMRLYCPEFSLRKAPRITVRGQTVQGGSVPLRKALLPSRAYPWSTKRPCGPLVFRRATGGSRVQRRVWGVKRGKGTIGALSPLVSAGRPRHPRPPKAVTVRAHIERSLAFTGCAAVSAEGKPSVDGKEKRAGRCISGTAYPLLRVKRRVLLYNYSK